MRLGFLAPRLDTKLLAVFFVGSCFLGILPRALAQSVAQAQLQQFTSELGATGRVVLPQSAAPSVAAAGGRSAAAAVSTLTINPTYNDAAMLGAGLTQAQVNSVHAAFAAAAAQFASNFSDPINVNITVTAVPGTSVFGSNLSRLASFTYPVLRNAFLGDSKSGDDATAVGLSGSVTPVDPERESHTWWVTSAQAKALGLIPDDLVNDGTFTFGAGFNYSFDPNNVGAGQYDFQGVAMHEISEIMGRIYGLGVVSMNPPAPAPPYLAYDLFRYLGPGPAGPGGPARFNGDGIYFSIDHGTTILKLYDSGAAGTDPSDWAVGTNDSFNAFSSAGVRNGLSAVDFRVMDVLGYDRIAPSGCTYTLGPGSGTSVPAGGAAGSITVSTAPGCAWSASSDSTSWLNVTSGFSGSGPGTVQFLAGANAAGQRIGTITIGGQAYTLTQAAGAAGCFYTLGPGSGTNIPSYGGSGSIFVTTSPGCFWNADSTSFFVQITSGFSGSGPGIVQFSVGVNSGTARVGHITIGDQTYTVSQPSGLGCTYTLGPGSGTSLPAAGGSGSMTVTTGAGCSWSASSDNPFLQITSGFSGTGPGTVQFSAPQNSAGARVATITVAAQTYTVTQDGGSCTYALGPGSATNIPAAGGNGSITVTTNPGCFWSSESNRAFIQITSGFTGAGPGTVQFSAPQNTGTPRAGIITIAGLTYTVTQAGAGGCAYTLSPGSGTNVPAAGGSGSITVTTSPGCAWFSASDSAWLSITNGVSGSGPGSVQFSAQANAGIQRSGTISIADQVYTVTQAGASSCAYTLSPGSGTNVPASGGGGSITVTTSTGCAWSAASDSVWLVVTNGSSGSGFGSVQFSAPANAGAQRVGTITIAGQTYTVTQGAGAGNCTYTLGPGSGTNVPVAGGSGSITVTASPGCAWSAASDSVWLVVTNGSSGTGSGSVQFSAQLNSAAQRAGVITIAGQTYTVTQAGASGCTYTLGPGSGTNVPAAGGSGSITVTTAPGCAWSAVSDSAWLIIVNGLFSGSDANTVQFSALLNSGAQRVGIITIAGQTYTVTQAGVAGPANTPDNALSLSQFVGGGTEWNTTLFVTNLSNTAEGYTIRFYDDAGLPKLMPIDTLGMVNSITGTLNPGETRRYQTGAAATLQVAWALLTPATPATARLAGYAVLRQTVPSGTSTVSSEGVVDFLGITDSKYVLLYDNFEGPVTTATFANPDALNPLTILVDVRDEAGTVLATDSIVLPPLGHTAFVLSDRFHATAGRRGSIRLNASPRGFTGMGIRFSQFGTFTSFRFLTSKDIQ